MPLAHRFLKVTRTFHLYLGVFSAPMLLFFAITGSLQTFGLHESSRGGSYAPPAWLVSAAQFHKKQTFVVPPRHARPARPVVASTESLAKTVGSAKIGQGAVPPKKNLVPMKIFFVVVALSLLISTLSGLYMAWRYSRKPRLVVALFAAGILLPLLLLLV